MSYITSGEGGEVIKFARVNATADGANTVIAAVPGKKLVIIGYALCGATAAGTATLQDTAGSPAIFGAIAFPTPSGTITFAGTQEGPAFETAVGLGFVISNSTSLDTLGHISYMEV